MVVLRLANLSLLLKNLGVPSYPSVSSDVTDYKHFEGVFARIEFETELFLKRTENRRPGRFRWGFARRGTRLFRRPP